MKRERMREEEVLASGQADQAGFPRTGSTGKPSLVTQNVCIHGHGVRYY